MYTQLKHVEPHHEAVPAKTSSEAFGSLRHAGPAHGHRALREVGSFLDLSWPLRPLRQKVVADEVIPVVVVAAGSEVKVEHV